ncbi:unnamed protein product [Adineta steineri]|uniref:G-protein coupled receptors family 1 profile domain-containing protein n=1 Tax=Adineta steineri TaxID=433720 RepID=A0A814YGL6_9BILA|nr:unnamed protein product [Adineta steineri]CAF3688035.1 unnamed protein product [Adineta steineri]
MSVLSLSSNSPLPYVQQQLIRYGDSIFLIFGVSGCCLNILLLSRRQFQTSSCCTYFQALSVIALIHITIALGLYLYTLDNVDPLGIAVICKLRFYIVQSTAMMYRWCLTIACFDRYALSSADVRLRKFANVKIARRVVVAIILIWLVLTLHIPIFYNTINHICIIYNNIFASLYHSAFLTLTGCIIPISCMAICTLLIHRNLTLKRQRRQQNAPKAKENEKLQSRRDQQVLIMLLVQMIFYSITIIPLMTMYFYNAITIYLSKTLARIIIERFALFIAEMINFLFPVCSFYLYTMASHMFRVELKAMLYSFFKLQWLKKSISIRPIDYEMKVKPKPTAQAIEFNSNKLERITEVSQERKNLSPDIIQ